MDELARIEAAYGCVAEYNRVRLEEEAEEYTPSEKEMLEQEVKDRVYGEKVRLLTGTPSDFAVKLDEEWKAKEPKRSDYADRNSCVYAGYGFCHDRTLAIMDAISSYYGEELTDKNEFYKTAPGTFAISVEYTEYGMIKNKDITNLTYDKFKEIYRDINYLFSYPSINYCNENGKNLILSGASLGSLRISDLKWAGVETEESLAKELGTLGFDEALLTEELTKQIASVA